MITKFALVFNFTNIIFGIFKALISQQSNQLKEIQEAIKVLQKNIDSINDESEALKSISKPSNTDNDKIIKQL